MQKPEGRRQKAVGHGRAVPNPRSKYSEVWLTGLALAFVALVVAGCASRGGSATSLPGRGALSLEVVPNPIIANRVSGDTYDFPFEAVIRETGGAEVRIERVRFEVSAFGGFPLYSETFGRDEIARRGFPQIVPANGQLRYQFSPRKSADDRLFGSVSATLRIDGVDTSGAPTSARTRVTVRRK